MTYCYTFKNLKIMHVYMVLSKVFYISNGKDYQVADALQPITVYSSYKKANETFEYFVNYYKKLGYEGPETKHRNLFPVEHITLKREDKRVTIYIIKSEVE